MNQRMHRYDERLFGLISGHVHEQLHSDDIALECPDSGEDLGEILDGLLCASGNDPEHVLKLYQRELSRTIINQASPRFLSFIPGAPTKAAQLFDMVVSSDALLGTFWLESAGVIAAENQVLRLIADLAGLPATAGGCFVSGGSAGNLSALVVARDTARRRLGLPVGSRLRVAVSDQAHSSVGSTLNVIGVEALVVPSVDHRFTGAALRAALDDDRDPSPVIAVVATAGTTNAGIIDDLAGIADVAEAHDLWFHVDAAYGGAGLFAPSVRQKFDGIERADSFIVDSHKWLFGPFGSGALIYREPQVARSVHSQVAPYLDVVQTHTGQSKWNPSDYAHQLTRTPGGMPLWFSLAVHGTDAYRSAIESGISIARETADLIRTEYPHLEVLRDPELSCLLFRRRGWSADEYSRWSKELLAAQIGFVLPTTWENEVVGRFAFVHPGTTMEMVRQVLDSTSEPAS
ncbi:pyridoxal phosphate-dependent decarboxylase family protein [Amycolatopsis regifaucium]|nr:pyridoxal-dependent decarboxylase [Amycolatopsis regifaucium]SFJ46503.1 Glutamate or tyrosine decarboxylase [Amycolatopsis regifaucium]